jgi:hypothetical protein
VVPTTVVIVECPEPCDKVTVLPDTGVSLESSRVTVTVEDEVPSSATEAGDADTVDDEPDTGPWNTTWAVSVTGVPSVLSVAV